MNAPSAPLPGLLKLYHNDLMIRRGLSMLGFGIIVAAGMYWVSRPVPGPKPPIDNSFDVALAKVGSIGGIVLAGVGLLIFLGRFRRVRQILREGVPVKGMVDDIEVITTTTKDKDSAIGTRHTRRSYYVTLSYEAIGQQWTVRQKLPNSGFVFGLVKGQPTDLIVHEWMPEKPLIRSVYLGSF
ncbi:hypothetical protein GC170_18640 [bacterium]|nr:hypothetical protein [bacterium]